MGGLVDALDVRGRLAFGPTAAAARLEGSKAFAKRAMEEAGVPTARWRHVQSLKEGIDAVKELAAPGVVIKADGLAAGKGVTVADNPEQAHAALREIFVEQRFGATSGPTRPSALVEERLIGSELSLLALCDGQSGAPAGARAGLQAHRRRRSGPEHRRHGRLFACARSAGRRGDGDGCSRPCADRPMDARAQGVPFHGVLYAGLMLTAEGPRVLEFNVRFGDPETQAILPRLRSDLLDLLLARAQPGGLIELACEEPPIEWAPDWAVTVVLASAGYPASSSRGRSDLGPRSDRGRRRGHARRHRVRAGRDDRHRRWARAQRDRDSAPARSPPASRRMLRPG